MLRITPYLRVAMKLAMLRPLLVVSFLICALAQVAGGQEKSLHWRSIGVDARLDSDGILRVRERQVMVFTGDWNGGERTFRVRTGQRFAFHRIARVDSISGMERPLIEGDLSQVDHFDWASGRSLRWRSRLPSDPFFLGTALEYVLEYSYENILVPRDGHYVLDHDFAFADRVGDIESYTLALTLDQAWRASPGFDGNFRSGPLPPGRGFVVTVPLEFTGAGKPAAVDFAPPVPARVVLAAILLAVIARLVVQRFRREHALGRFAPLVDSATIDDTWLADHVFARAPEVVGAAWDDTTGASEVAAVLARLVSEAKLASEVRREGLFFKKEVLSLKLLVPRSALNEYERSLIDALFIGGSDWTDTVQVREHYKKTGFDPASRIRGPLERIVNALYAGRTAAKASPWRSLLLFLFAVAMLAAAVVRRPADAPLVGIGVAVWLALYITAAIAANLWRNRVTGLATTSLVFLLPLGLYTAAVLALLAIGGLPSGILALTGLTLLALTQWSSVMNVAGWKHSVERLEFRRRLAAARAYFMDELRRETPRLRDEWFPYLIAFGLAKDMDRWFRAFGGESVRAMSTSSSSLGAGSRSHTGGQSWTGFGGGGGFSGAGASASWAAAASSMAAGVASPSSGGSSSGGGGGGGSSGGGGGGGW